MADVFEQFGAGLANSQKQRRLDIVLAQATKSGMSSRDLMILAAKNKVTDDPNFIAMYKQLTADEAAKQAQQQDAEFNMKAGTSLNKEIGGYLKENPSASPMQSLQSGAIKNDTIPTPQGASSFALGSDSFNQNLSNFAKQLQGESSLSGIPTEQSGSLGQQPTSQLKPVADTETAYNGIMKGIPVDIAQDLIFKYHNGLIKPKDFLKEVAASKKSLYDINVEENKANQASARKIKEEGMKSQGEIDKQYVTSEGQMDLAGVNNEAQLQRQREENASQERIASINTTNNKNNERNALNAAEFGAKEKDMLGAVEEGKLLLTGLVETFKANKFGDIGDMVGEGAAKIPLAGKFVAGRNKEFQNQKRLAAETWLRAATGAAAPAYEVETYTGFLPSESDPKEVADKKIENFFSKISAKASARAKIFDIEGQALEGRGLTDLANIKYEQGELVRQLITSGKSSIPKISETADAPKSNGVIKSKSGNVYNLD